jgi:hypothetical protein
VFVGESKMEIQSYRPPEGWGGDTLSAYLEDAYRGRHAAFVHKRDWFAKLASIDAAFVTIETDWKGKASDLAGRLLACMLFVRSHCAFRTAAEHAFAGQLSEAYPEVRAALEYAATALHIALNAPLAEAWMRRHDSADAQKAVRNIFTPTNFRASITKVNPDAAKIFDTLYQRAIDFGGHPNERAMTGSLTIKALDDGGKEFQQAILHGDGLQMDHTIKTTAQSGVCSLEILEGAFPDRFKELGVTEGLHVLKRGL